MNKQEFLAFSLPYGLKTINVNYIEEDILIIRNFLSIDFNGNIKVDGIVMPLNCNITAHKPILRPITDLTKEIEHNDEKFVPIVILGWSENIIGWSKNNINLAIENMRFDDAIKLIEWHFDIAGLIEKGEAIDVNTLPENPYK